MFTDTRANTEFVRVSEDYLQDYLRRNPTSATALGFHEFDQELEDLSSDAVADEIRSLRAWIVRLDEMESVGLSKDLAVDRELLRRHLLGETHELEEVKSWERDPNYYNDLASSAIHYLLIRDFGPLDERLRNAAARCRRIPDFLRTGEENLKRAVSRRSGDAGGGVPAIWVEIALEEFAGARDFMIEVVPQCAGQSPNLALRDELLAANRAAVEAHDRMIRFLEAELLPVANGEFALGPDGFQTKLRQEEWVDASVDEILRRGQDELLKTQSEMAEWARRIDGNANLRETLQKYSREHPAADDLIDAYRRKLDTVREFVIERDLVSIPEGELQVTETPPFLRSMLFAALDTPGPFETQLLPSFFYVTPVAAHWSSSEKEEYLRSHSNFSLETTTIHEAYPGHFVQQLHVADCDSKLRKIFGAGTFIEGWAHYCEELMVDQGYGGADPRVRLFQLHEAIWRIGRLIVATRMHCENMSRSEAEEFLVRETYQERTNAVREVKRYTRDPLVLMYSWGKWQIMGLRERYRAAQPDGFSLRKFHDWLLSQGEPPINALETLILD